VVQAKKELPKLPPSIQSKLTTNQTSNNNKQQPTPSETPKKKKKEDFSNEYAGKKVIIYFYGMKPKKCIFLISTDTWIKARDLETMKITYFNKRYVIAIVRDKSEQPKQQQKTETEHQTAVSDKQ